jgi:hypothetical protein
LGNAFVQKPGGCISYIGNTSYGIGNPNWSPSSDNTDWGPAMDYAKCFFPRLLYGLSNSHTSVGMTLDRTRCLMLGALAPATNVPGAFDPYLFMMFSLNLQGDPELNILSVDPTQFSITLPPNLVCDNQIAIQNKLDVSTGVPYALVGICNDFDIKTYNYANSSGIASFVLSPTTTAPLYVTVTGRNKVPYHGQITVVPATFAVQYH